MSHASSELVGERVASERVEWLWADDWYDGPISGVVAVDADRRYAVWAGEDGRHRIFQLYRLSPEVLAAETERQDYFCQHVGRHFDFRTEDQSTRPAEGHARYYERYPAGEHRRPEGTADGWFYG